MGGSAIGADLAAAAVGPRARNPIYTLRRYDLPPWIGEETAVLCSSYSGNTEETLSCYSAAREAGAQIIALTTGGKLAELARADGVPVIGVPSGMQPRAAVGYMAVCSLEVAALCGVAPSLRSEIEAAASFLRQLADEWGIKMMHVYQTTPRDIEIWVYTPGEKPRVHNARSFGAI